MYFVEAAIRKRGGIARVWELVADGIGPEFIEMATRSRRIVRLRKG